jgi:hypothetical protein
MEEKTYYIYKIIFLKGIPGRYYIGKHYQSINKKDTYTGSGIFCKNYFKKYGKIENVTYVKKVICYCSSKEELAQKEKEIIGNLYIEDSNCMNYKAGGEGGWVIKKQLTEEHKRKISKNHKGMLGKHHSKEAKIKIAKGQIGKSYPGHVHSEDEKLRRKQSLAKYYSEHPGTCSGKHRVYNSNGTYHYE